MPLKYSKKAALEPLSFGSFFGLFVCLIVFFQQWKRNICSGACGLPVLGSNCYIALTERRRTQPRVFVISEVCGATLQANIRARGRDRCLDICCQTKSDTLPREQRGVGGAGRGAPGRRKKISQTLLATICRLLCCSEKS